MTLDAEDEIAKHHQPWLPQEKSTQVERMHEAGETLVLDESTKPPRHDRFVIISLYSSTF